MSKIKGANVFSIGFAMTLRAGCYQKYKYHHDFLWPEIAQSMADNHISMAIFRLGERLIVHAIAPTEADWAQSRKVPKLNEWHDVMKELLECDLSGSIAVEQLEPAFEFGEFAGCKK